MSENNKRSQFFKKKQREYTPPLNFPMVVESYDLKATPPNVKGFRFDTDEDVTVSLIPPSECEGINKGNNKRPEISDLAKKRKLQSDPSVEVGGMIYIEDAKLQPDGSFATKWIKALSHTDTEAEVFICTAHYAAPKLSKDTIVNGVKTQGTPYAKATLMFDFDHEMISEKLAATLGYQKPFKVDTTNDLKIELLKLLENSKNVGAGIRIKIGDEFDATNFYKQQGKSIEMSIDEFIKETFDDNMQELLKEEGSLIEVIPYCSVFMGKKTASENFQKIAAGDALEKITSAKLETLRYQQKYENEAGEEKFAPAFGKSVVAIRFVLDENDEIRHDEETGMPLIYLSDIKPLFSRKDLMVGLGTTLSYTQTKDFSPTIEYYTPPQKNQPENVPGEDNEAAEENKAASPAPAEKKEMVKEEPKSEPVNQASNSSDSQSEDTGEENTPGMSDRAGRFRRRPKA